MNVSDIQDEYTINQVSNNFENIINKEVSVNTLKQSNKIQ
jgi:hypothetical protein